MRHQHPQERASDRIQTDEGVVRQKDQGEENLADLPSPGADNTPDVGPPRQTLRPAPHTDQRGHQSGQRDDREDQQRSQAIEFRDKHPAADQE